MREIEPLKIKNGQEAESILTGFVNHGLDSNAYVEFMGLASDSTLLHLAAYLDLGQVVRDLLDDGADVNAVNLAKETPLHLACSGIGSRILVSALLVHSNASLNCQDRFGETPLHRAARFENLPLIAYLLDEGANPLILSRDGITAIDLCQGAPRRYLSERTAQILLENEFPTLEEMKRLKV
ncbi:MAG: ankyrin repeat domain-containing protein [Candidatus Omnitrophica bacterium]|nr:ankyrin repeat domain-containing protein [Candidatus Omnitrophota bacterium]MCA9416699.1 ankyrin repeat domain-containing protein [Candidatus Omnitrophota bacterium]MCA9432481.1 ankyrin repeat domain-containing protein [Candidatus Omnitrophota bacterium]MCA9444105.1 ankyrin repeat domain-containing protein [Candidatus Omnitrophota bacterium]